MKTFSKHKMIMKLGSDFDGPAGSDREF